MVKRGKNKGNSVQKNADIYNSGDTLILVALLIARFVCSAERLRVYSNAEKTRYS